MNQGKSWKEMAQAIGTKTENQCRNRKWNMLKKLKHTEPAEEVETL